MRSPYGYAVVRTGDLPENPTNPTFNATESATCAEWASLPDKAQREVIRFHLVTNEVHRYPAAEAERIAYDFRNLRDSLHR